jgi:hypothetical protein
VLPFTVGIRDSAVQLVCSTLGSVVVEGGEGGAHHVGIGQRFDEALARTRDGEVRAVVLQVRSVCR